MKQGPNDLACSNVLAQTSGEAYLRGGLGQTRVSSQNWTTSVQALLGVEPGQKSGLAIGIIGTGIVERVRRRCRSQVAASTCSSSLSRTDRIQPLLTMSPVQYDPIEQLSQPKPLHLTYSTLLQPDLPLLPLLLPLPPTFNLLLLSPASLPFIWMLWKDSRPFTGSKRHWSKSKCAQLYSPALESGWLLGCLSEDLVRTASLGQKLDHLRSSYNLVPPCRIIGHGAWDDRN